MTIIEAIEKFGHRKTARAIVNKRIISVCGMHIDDLPDSYELCEVIDDIEGLLNNYEDTKELIQTALNSIDEEFIESIVYS